MRRLCGSGVVDATREKEDDMTAVKKPVCPCCSSSVYYPQPGGFFCDHCSHEFTEPVEGCAFSKMGEHDEDWMNDGICACGADGAESVR